MSGVPDEGDVVEYEALEKHPPQIGLHRRRPQLRVEERDERSEEHRIVQQHIDPGRLGRKPSKLVGQDRFP